MKKIALFLMLTVAIGVNVFAGYDYKISDYIVQDTSGSGLSVNFDSKHNSDSLDAAYSGSQLNLNGYIYGYENKRDEKKVIGLQLGVGSGSGDSNRIVELGKNGTESLNAYANYKKYVIGEVFIALNPNVYLDYNNRIKEGNGSQISASFAAGIGRIDNVNNAKMALYILEDLDSKGCIKNEPTNKQIEKFAEYLAEVSNKRFFDNREKRIYQLTKLSSFLKDEGIIGNDGKDSEIKTFTTINDNWNYANNPIRLRGQEFYVEYKPTKRINYNMKKNELNISYEYEKPLNNNLQLSINCKSNNTWYNMKSKNYLGTEYSQMALVSIGVSYYPNSRDIFGIGIIPLEFNFNKKEIESNITTKVTEKDSKSNINVSYERNIDSNSRIKLVGNLSMIKDEQYVSQEDYLSNITGKSYKLTKSILLEYQYAIY